MNSELGVPPPPEFVEEAPLMELVMLVIAVPMTELPAAKIAPMPATAMTTITMPSVKERPNPFLDVCKMP